MTRPGGAALPARVDLRWFWFGVPPSVFMGMLLTPVFAGTDEYLVAYGLLFLFSCICLFTGWRRQSRRRVAQAAWLMWSAPVVPHAVFMVAGMVLRAAVKTP